MKVIIAKAGSSVNDSDAFKLESRSVPEPGEQDLLVRVIALGMNPVDTKIRQRTEEDCVLGWDVCGIVESVGGQVRGFEVGDRVFYAGDLTRSGCNSEYHLVDYRIVGHAPEKLSPEAVAAMPLTSITAWEALFSRMGFVAEPDANTGKSILIIGGAGGVGSVAIQLARWAGLKVIATASRAETVDWCRELGAELVVNHRQDLMEELKQHGVNSVHAIFCTTQMEKHWQAMSDCIAPQGDVVLIDDPVGPVDIRLFKLKSVSLCWEFMYTRSMFQTEDMASQGDLLSRVAALLDGGVLVSTLQETLTGLTPENIQAMHIRQESGSMLGKQVLIV